MTHILQHFIFLNLYRFFKRSGGGTLGLRAQRYHTEIAKFGLINNMNNVISKLRVKY